MDNQFDNIVAQMYRVLDEQTIDLFVHPDDEARVRAALRERRDAVLFRIHVAGHLTPGHLIAVDKSALLKRPLPAGVKNSVVGSVSGSVIQTDTIDGGVSL